MNAVRYSPQLTRQVLLDAAAQQIHRHGYHASSLETILAHTGVTKGALYHHFANKKALSLSVIDEVYRDQVVGEWRIALEGATDPVRALLTLLERKRSAACTDSLAHGCPVNNLAQEMSSEDEEFRQLIETVLEGWRMAISDAFERGRTAGTVRPEVDPRAVAVFVTSAIEGAIGAGKNARDAELFRTAIRELESYVRALSPKTGNR
jgi:AcrR family transcriptional regulator